MTKISSRQGTGTRTAGWCNRGWGLAAGAMLAASFLCARGQTTISSLPAATNALQDTNLVAVVTDPGVSGGTKRAPLSMLKTYVGATGGGSGSATNIGQIWTQPIRLHALGDSFTAGCVASVCTPTWLTWLTNLFWTNDTIESVQNYAVNGELMYGVYSTQLPQVLTNLAGSGTQNVAVVMAGVNDFYTPSSQAHAGRIATNVYFWVSNVNYRLGTAGVQVVVCTVPQDINQNTVYTNSQPAYVEKDRYNALLRTDWRIRWLADIAETLGETNSGLWMADGVHPATNSGMIKLASTVDWTVRHGPRWGGNLGWQHPSNLVNVIVPYMPTGIVSQVTEYFYLTNWYSVTNFYTNYTGSPTNVYRYPDAVADLTFDTLNMSLGYYVDSAPTPNLFMITNAASTYNPSLERSDVHAVGIPGSSAKFTGIPALYSLPGVPTNTAHFYTASAVPAMTNNLTVIAYVWPTDEVDSYGELIAGKMAPTRASDNTNIIGDWSLWGRYDATAGMHVFEFTFRTVANKKYSLYYSNATSFKASTKTNGLNWWQVGARIEGGTNAQLYVDGLRRAVQAVPAADGGVTNTTDARFYVGGAPSPLTHYANSQGGKTAWPWYGYMDNVTIWYAAKPTNVFAQAYGTDGALAYGRAKEYLGTPEDGDDLVPVTLGMLREIGLTLDRASSNLTEALPNATTSPYLDVVRADEYRTKQNPNGDTPFYVADPNSDSFTNSLTFYGVHYDGDLLEQYSVPMLRLEGYNEAGGFNPLAVRVMTNLDLVVGTPLVGYVWTCTNPALFRGEWQPPAYVAGAHTNLSLLSMTNTMEQGKWTGGYWDKTYGIGQGELRVYPTTFDTGTGAGVSNGTAAIEFTTWFSRLSGAILDSVTNTWNLGRSNAQSLASWKDVSNIVSGAASSGTRDVVLAGTGTSVSATSTNGTNFYTVDFTGGGVASLSPIGITNSGYVTNFVVNLAATNTPLIIVTGITSHINIIVTNHSAGRRVELLLGGASMAGWVTATNLNVTWVFEPGVNARWAGRYTNSILYSNQWLSIPITATGGGTYTNLLMGGVAYE